MGYQGTKGRSKDMITFTVPGRPIPAVRMTQRSKYKSPQAQRYLEYKEYVGWIAKQAMGGREPMMGAVCLNALFYVAGTLPDLSNLIKGIEDALNGVVWADDRQVCKYKEPERISCEESKQRAEVQVWEV